MQSKSSKIFFIGAGTTGSVTASLIQKQFPNTQIVLCDKGRGAGGRMSVAYNSNDKNCQADLGAQYISTNSSLKIKYQEIYSSLIQNKIINKLVAPVLGMKSYSEDTEHFIVSDGMNTVVKHFLKTIPKENIYFNEKVIALEKKNGCFKIFTDNNIFESEIVVSTIPVPQFLLLKGAIENDNIYYSKLQNITYSSRFAIVLFFGKDCTFPKLEWACKYINHEIFCFVSVDNLKKNKLEHPTAVIFHTNTEFGKIHLEKSLSEVEIILTASIKKMFPEWPVPEAVKCHKWRYSQVIDSYPGKPGFVIVSEAPSLIIGGDAFSKSTFDGCLFSAYRISDFIIEKLKK